MKKLFVSLLMLSSLIAYGQTSTAISKKVLREITLTGSGYEPGLQRICRRLASNHPATTGFKR